MDRFATVLDVSVSLLVYTLLVSSLIMKLSELGIIENNNIIRFLKLEELDK
jgi:hypothetical protein